MVQLTHLNVILHIPIGGRSIDLGLWLLSVTTLKVFEYLLGHIIEDKLIIEYFFIHKPRQLLESHVCIHELPGVYNTL